MSYSGFLSNFSGATSNTDILSTRTYSSNGTGGGSNYGASYFTIGNVLVQFTDVSKEAYMSIFGGTGAHTITFPVKFSGTPWCIVASPSSNNQESGQFTVITDTFTESSFNVYVVNDGTALTYIAIGLGPPGAPT
jgi:hypothetical protein